MQPQDVSGGAASPQRVERKCIVERIDKQTLAPVLTGEGAIHSDLGAQAPEPYFMSDWRLVSHTFAIQDDETGILTYILERNR